MWYFVFCMTGSGVAPEAGSCTLGFRDVHGDVACKKFTNCRGPQNGTISHSQSLDFPPYRSVSAAVPSGQQYPSARTCHSIHVNHVSHRDTRIISRKARLKYRRAYHRCPAQIISTVAPTDPPYRL